MAAAAYQPAPIPSCDRERLDALRRYQILDTAPEQAYDDLASIVAHIFETPVALVSLVDEHRQWFKARIGMAQTETPRAISFCGHAILQREPLVVPDAAADERFAGNPLVVLQPRVRFYAGAPLITDDGHALGTICAVDFEPRTVEPGQLRVLEMLSRQVVTQLELRRSARAVSRLVSIVEHCEDAIIGKDLGGIITDWNRGAERLYGYTEAEAVGKTVDMLMPPGRAAEMPELLARIRRGERVDHHRTERVTRDGRRLHVSVTISPIRDLEGRVVGASSIVRDISDRIEAERKLAKALELERLANAELQRANEARTAFVSIVSHEFRTPLTVIQGFSEMLSTEAFSADEVREYSADIHKEATRLGRLINTMLDLDRMEAGKMPMNKEPVELYGLIREVAQRTRPIAPKHTILLELAEGAGLVHADRDRLTQVVLNLLSNAIKYSPEGGEIRVLARIEGGQAMVTVRDQGMGIETGMLEKVFDRYSRAGLRDRSIEGTGLGLPISRQIVALHGGRIWAESEPGKGSAFHFTLPTATPPR